MGFPGRIIIRNRPDFAPPHAESLPVLRRCTDPARESTTTVAGAGPLIPGRSSRVEQCDLHASNLLPVSPIR